MAKKTISKKVNPIGKERVLNFAFVHDKKTKLYPFSFKGVRLSNGVKKEIAQYIDILKQDKLPIKKVVLFGSYAKGVQNKWSDVDLCIVSPKFKNTFSALQYLSSKVIFDMKYTIEPHPYHPKNFINEDPLVWEIKKTGKIIYENL
ncbi:MAG: nucleotidyltransferase domain-containing protein [Patescibacteria group bacterium]